MGDRSEFELIGEFREALAQGELTDDLTVDYELSGGMPSEDLEQASLAADVPTSLRLTGNGRLTVPREAPVQLDPSETRELLQQVASSLDKLVPRAEARFIPDSTVGSVKIGVRGAEATLYFLADEGQRRGQEKAIAKGAAEAIRPLRELSRRLRAEKERGR
jgi:hypothetical protein